MIETFAVKTPVFPDELIVKAYRRAAEDNVLAAVNSEVFFGYFSVCADGVDFGLGNSFPALDGTQISEALLWLGRIDVVLANWDYIKSFQKASGQLPFAILPANADTDIGPPDMTSHVEMNGGLYRHWVPGDPLRTLPYTSYIQSADMIYRFTLDRDWLKEQISSINMAAEYLASLTDEDGAVRGAGYYVENPTRIEYDGVSQCFAVDAFRRVARLNRVLDNRQSHEAYCEKAERTRRFFCNEFWNSDRFVEYIHPLRGKISNHGWTDVDWSSIATDVADASQVSRLWPRLREEEDFYYGDMPTGIATHPDSYEKWESVYHESPDLASMGRVWYTESWARARMKDGEGLLKAMRKVCRVGEEDGFFWRERYNRQGGYGANKYCEYPANLIRIVHHFILGQEMGIDGTLHIHPNVPGAYWDQGFGFDLAFRTCRLSYAIKRNRFRGEYSGSTEQMLCIRIEHTPGYSASVKKDELDMPFQLEEDRIILQLPPVEPGGTLSITVTYEDPAGPSSFER